MVVKIVKRIVSAAIFLGCSLPLPGFPLSFRLGLSFSFRFRFGLRFATSFRFRLRRRGFGAATVVRVTAARDNEFALPTLAFALCGHLGGSKIYTACQPSAMVHRA